MEEGLDGGRAGHRPDSTAARLCFQLQQPSYDTDSLIGVLDQLGTFCAGQQVVLIWDGPDGFDWRQAGVMWTTDYSSLSVDAVLARPAARSRSPLSIDSLPVPDRGRMIEVLDRGARTNAGQWQPLWQPRRYYQAVQNGPG